MPPYTREYTVQMEMPLDLALNKPLPQFAGHPEAYLSVRSTFCMSTSCPRCVFTCSVSFFSLEAGMHHVSLSTFIVCTLIVIIAQQHNAAVYWDLTCINFEYLLYGLSLLVENYMHDLWTPRRPHELHQGWALSCGHVFSFCSVSKEFKGLVKFFTGALSFI